MNTEKELKERLKIIYPTEEDLLDALLTALGMSAELTRYVSDTSKDFGKLPLIVKYAIAVTAGNMCTFFAANPYQIVKKEKFPTAKILSGEQAEEALLRKFEHVIKTLYESIQERELDG